MTVSFPVHPSCSPDIPAPAGVSGLEAETCVIPSALATAPAVVPEGARVGIPQVVGFVKPSPDQNALLSPGEDAFFLARVYNSRIMRLR